VHTERFQADRFTTRWRQSVPICALKRPSQLFRVRCFTFRHSIFCDVTQRRLVVTNVYVWPVGSIFTGKVCPLKTGPIGSTETSVTNYQPAPRNIKKSEGLIYTASDA
jgi:hypothetical protein